MAKSDMDRGGARCDLKSDQKSKKWSQAPKYGEKGDKVWHGGGGFKKCHFASDAFFE